MLLISVNLVTFQDKYILWKSLKQKASIPYQFNLYVFYQKLIFFQQMTIPSLTG